jgi:hypothetical protein
MEQTARFQIPFLAAGQVQKELTHNEALERIGILLCPVVEGAPQAEPPANPPFGACYLVAPEGSGAWQGEGGSIACFTAGGWRFVAPIEGVSVTDKVSGETFQWRSGAWEGGVLRCQQIQIGGQTLLRERQPAIADPDGGAVIDSESRDAVGAILNALRTHGLIN